jgi:peptidoglycan/xylan/chitin deacetylase (PgdA/CDA1 family)
MAVPDDPLVPVRVIDGGSERLAWSEGMRFSLPQSFLQASQLSEHQDIAGNLRVPPTLEVNLPDALDALRRRAAFTDAPPLSARLPVSYQHVPAWLRSAGASLIGRWHRRRVERWAAFPGWPLDLSADFLGDLVNDDGRTNGPTAVLLTHDLDSAEGLQSLVGQFLCLEEKAGARSVNFVVPCAWPIDAALLHEVRERGHEIGVHGYDHSNRTAFADAAERRRRLEAGKQVLAGHDVRGYRAPSLLRTRGLLRDVGEFYAFDSSIPTSGGLFPVPNNGCASARPFRIEDVAEIPLSLPRDGSLRFLGYNPEQILELWIKCAESISRSGGVVVLLTHCEARFSGNKAMLDTYQRFLEYIAGSDRYSWAGPADILARSHKVLSCG